MSRRFLKWLIVALITAALVMALQQLLEPGASAAVPAGRGYQSPLMAAMPWAPASQASGRSASFIPPMA